MGPSSGGGGGKNGPPGLSSEAVSQQNEATGQPGGPKGPNNDQSYSSVFSDQQDKVMNFRNAAKTEAKNVKAPIRKKHNYSVGDESESGSTSNES